MIRYEKGSRVTTLTVQYRRTERGESSMCSQTGDLTPEQADVIADDVHGQLKAKQDRTTFCDLSIDPKPDGSWSISSRGDGPLTNAQIDLIVDRIRHCADDRKQAS